MKNPRHIVLTGASSGLGAALALVYAAPGVLLSLHGRDAQRLEAVAVQARQKGAEVSTHIGDVADAVDTGAWIKEMDAATPIDLLIANAGISGATSSADDLDARASAVFDVNVEGVFNTVHPVLPLMAQRKRGQVALMSSLASFRGFAGAAAYGASKASVRIYGEALRAEMAPYGLEINVICPGFVKTPMTDVNCCPMPFLMTPERAAALIRKGLEANRARIAFPWQMYVILRVLAGLPQSVLDFVTVRMPRK